MPLDSVASLPYPVWLDFPRRNSKTWSIPITTCSRCALRRNPPVMAAAALVDSSVFIDKSGKYHAEPFRHSLCRRQTRDPGRRQFPRPRLPLRRRRSLLRRFRSGMPHQHRRRSRTHRLRRHVGPRHSWPCPARRHRSGPASRHPRNLVRDSESARGRDGRDHHPPRPLGRKGSHGQQRHRSHDELHPPRPGLHRSGSHRQIRRLLPRPRRFASRQSGIRRPHSRPTRQRGCPRSPRSPDDNGAVQRRRGPARGLPVPKVRRSPPSFWSRSRQTPASTCPSLVFSKKFEPSATRRAACSYSTRS